MAEKQYRNGSFTVEASAVMGMALLVIGLILFLCSFLHGRAWLTASAYEQAITGRIQETTGLFGISDVRKTTELGEEKNTVSFQADCIAAWGGAGKSIDASAEIKKIKPVSHIWKIQAIRESGG